MKHVNNIEFLNGNSLRSYPFSAASGNTVPTSCLLDLSLVVGEDYSDVYVSSVYDSGRLVSVSFVSDTGPVGAITAPAVVSGEEYRHCAVTPLAPGVSGWAVLGRSANSGMHRLDADSGAIASACIRVIRPPVVRSLRAERSRPGSGLDGSVRLTGSGIRFVPDGDNIGVELTADDSSEFRGLCNRYPDRGECGNIVRSLSGVPPDEDGVITIRFTN